jgi:hypothetical protein
MCIFSLLISLSYADNASILYGQNSSGDVNIIRTTDDNKLMVDLNFLNFSGGSAEFDNITINGNATGIFTWKANTTYFTWNGSFLEWIFGDMERIPWVNLTDYPAACPSGAITQLGDTITCTDDWVDVAGDTMTGNLSFSQDNGIRLYANNTDTFDDGNSIELYSTRGTAKPYIAWYNESNEGVGWLGCHYNLSNGDVHQHCSFETPDTDTGTINTRLEISYGKAVSDMFIRASGIGNFILGSGVDLGGRRIIKKIEGTNEIDIYPSNQGTFALRISNNSIGTTLASLGSTIIKLLDNLDAFGYSVNATTIYQNNKVVCDEGDNCGIGNWTQDSSSYYTSSQVEGMNDTFTAENTSIWNNLSNTDFPDTNESTRMNFLTDASACSGGQAFIDVSDGGEPVCGNVDTNESLRLGDLLAGSCPSNQFIYNFTEEGVQQCSAITPETIASGTFTGESYTFNSVAVNVSASGELTLGEGNKINISASTVYFNYQPAQTGATDYMCVDANNGQLSVGDSCTDFEDLKISSEQVSKDDFKVLKVVKEIYSPEHYLAGQTKNFFFTVAFDMGGQTMEGEIKVPGHMSNESIGEYLETHILKQQGLYSRYEEVVSHNVVGSTYKMGSSYNDFKFQGAVIK